jgi:GMP synthase (glutamine-hydrolysing)
MKPVVIAINHADEIEQDAAAARLEALGYRMEWVTPAGGEALPEIADAHVGVIAHGGRYIIDDPANPFMLDELAWVGRWLQTGRPYLGFCLGAQLAAKALGAEIGAPGHGQAECGFTALQPEEAGRDLFAGLSHVYQFHYHGFDLPAGSVRLASTALYPNQAAQFAPNAYGFQFHAEYTRPMIEALLAKDPETLAMPGADPAEKQLADADAYVGAQNAWLGDVVEKWISGADLTGRVAA